jgi:hypothetical protein
MLLRSNDALEVHLGKWGCSGGYRSVQMLNGMAAVCPSGAPAEECKEGMDTFGQIRSVEMGEISCQDNVWCTEKW